MAKRSDEQRHPRDFYPTPLKGALPLIGTIDLEYNSTDAELPPMKFIEPFAGNGALTDHLCLSRNIECVYESDIDPQNNARIQTHGYEKIDMDLVEKVEADVFISNPPWVNTKASGQQLFTLIEYLASMRPTALLLDGGFAFNVGSSKLMEHCITVIPVGRLKWIPDSKYTGTEDCAWFIFDMKKRDSRGPHFHPRKKWSLPDAD